MANLGPQHINQSFGDLLQLPNGLTPAIQNVQDGSGNVTPLEISTTAVDFPISSPSGASGMISDLATDAGSDYIGFLQAGTGAVTDRSAQDKMRESVSVLDFGADPTGTTNSSTAIQTALDSGASAVYIPAGIYIINQSITFPATLKYLYGDPLKSILVSQTNAANYLFIFSTCAVHLSGLVLYGAKIPAVGGSETVPSARNGINANVSGDRGKFTDVVLYGFNVGMYLGKNDASSYMHLFDHCDFNSNNTGLYVIDGVNQTAWLNCVFRSNVDYALRIEPTVSGVECVSLALYNCTIEYTLSTTAGMVAKNVRGLDVSACYFEGNKTTAMYVYGDSTNGSQAVTIHNTYFFFGSDVNQRGDGVKVGGNVINCEIRNNHFEGYTISGFYPIKLVSSIPIIEWNIYNNCTGNPLNIISDFGYNLIDSATLNNHTLVRSAVKTDGSGNASISNLGLIQLYNTSGRLFVKITITRQSDDVVTVFDEQSVFMRAINGGGSIIGIGYRPNPPTGNITFSVGSTSSFNGALYCNLAVTISGGAVDTYHSFVVETTYGQDAAFSGAFLTTGSYS